MNNIYKISLLCIMLFSMACSKKEGVEEVVADEPKPLAVFTYAQATPDDAFTIEFNNSSENAKSIRWEFGDDSVSTEVSPKHTYLSTGIYRVFLTITNGQGFKAKREVIIRLNADDVLNFTATPLTAGNLKLNVSSPTTFTDFEWAFEGGEISNDASPETNVSSGSIKKVVLTAKTSKGSTAVISRLITDFGVGQDVTTGSVLVVSRENRSGVTSGEGSLKLIDNDLGSKWLLFDFKSESAQLTLTSSQVVRFYSLTSGGDAKGRDPKNWILEGSEDLITWDLLDTRTNESFATRTMTRLFTIPNTKAYKYYKWTIQNNFDGGSLMQIAEWRLYKIN